MHTPHLHTGTQANTPWRLTAGYVRRVGATVPFTSLSASPCEVELDEVVVHARLLSTAQRAGGPPPSDVHDDEAPSPPPEDAESLPAGSSIADGVRMIAGGIENLLHQLCIRVRDLSVHVVAPADTPGAMEPCLLLSLASFTFSSSDNVPESTGAAGKPLLLDKRCSMDGLLLELLVQPSRHERGQHADEAEAGHDDAHHEDAGNDGNEGDDTASSEQPCSTSCSVLLCSNEGAGCAASLRLRLESSDGLQSGEVGVDVRMEPLQLQLHSSVLVHLLTMARRAAAGRGSTTNARCARVRRVMLHHARHSTTTASTPAPAPPLESVPSAAQDLFRGILLPDVQSFVADALTWGGSTHAASLLQGDWGDLPAGGPRGPSRDPRAAWEQEWLAASGDWGPAKGAPCDLRASLHRAAPVLDIRAELRSADVALVLWYDDGGEGRLAAECSEVVIRARMADRGIKGEVEIQRVEAAEYLALHDDGDASTLPLQRFAQLPERLPPSGPVGDVPRPVLSFCGVTHAPLQGAVHQSAHGSLYSSTLSQLTELCASWASAGGARQAMQVWPVLALHPPARGGPCLRVALDGAWSASPRLDADVTLRPLSVWLSTAMVRRLQRCVAPLMDAADGEAGADGTPGASTYEETRVFNVLCLDPVHAR